MSQDADRLVSPNALNVADVEKLAASEGRPLLRARKKGLIGVRIADRDETVITKWDGIETQNVARPGDKIVTSLDSEARALRDAKGRTNVYVITAARFDELYAPTERMSEHGPVYGARGQVRAMYFAHGFDILAPWGERQLADRGYIVINGPDVYGNHAETFEKTYEILAA
ncbi:MAG: hypothetical protein K2Y05_04985 [Hyphomicrobiaceae bacterium]|nr:hypothetical protein [Hyphomicrobiaceae bacterium]